jgi:archaellum component FlaC
VNPAKKEQPAEFKAVNYTGMIPILTEAIQEQQKGLEAKDARIDELEKQLKDLKTLVLNMQQSR